MRSARRWLVVLVLASGVAWLLKGEPVTTAPERAADGGATPASQARVGVAPEAPNDAGAGQVTWQVAPEATTGAVCGVVVSALDGAPIPGAEVTFGSERGAASTRTDTIGAFCAALEGSGPLQVASVTAEGFLPFGPEWGQSPLSVNVPAGVRVDGLRITLTPSLELVVTVVDAKGAPVPGAALRVLSPRADEAALFPRRERFTADAAGQVRLATAEGSVLEAWHPTHGRGREEVDADALKARKLSVRLEAARTATSDATLEGLVKDEAGLPVAGALVVARSATRAYPQTYGDRDGYRALTRSDGRFTFEELEPGRYDLSAHTTGASPARRFDLAVPARDVVLVLGTGASLYGTVTDDRGQPVPSFALSLEWKKGPLETLAVLDGQVVNPSGQWRVRGVAEGRYRLVVQADGFAPTEREVEVHRDDVRVDVTLERGGVLEGEVRSRGAPLPQAMVRLEPLGGGSAYAVPPSATSDALGHFVLQGVPPGPLSLHVAASGHHTRVIGQARVGTTVTVELTPLEPDAGKRTELVGIGAVLKGRDDALVIGEVLPSGGAARAGLVPGDEVVAVDGVLVTALGFGGAIAAIRGEAETVVRLSIRKGGKAPAREVAVQRRRIGA